MVLGVCGCYMLFVCPFLSAKTPDKQTIAGCQTLMAFMANVCTCSMVFLCSSFLRIFVNEWNEVWKLFLWMKNLCRDIGMEHIHIYILCIEISTALHVPCLCSLSRYLKRFNHNFHANSEIMFMKDDEHMRLPQIATKTNEWNIRMKKQR